MSEVMPLPTENKWKEIVQDFWRCCYFPNCIGSLDGKHVVIQAPPNSGSLYFNYKKTFYVVLMAQVDAHYNFIAVDVGAYGINSDGGIFMHSKLGKGLDRKQLNVPQDTELPGTNIIAPFIILGDEAFPLKDLILENNSMTIRREFIITDIAEGEEWSNILSGYYRKNSEFIIEESKQHPKMLIT